MHKAVPCRESGVALAIHFYELSSHPGAIECRSLGPETSSTSARSLRRKNIILNTASDSASQTITGRPPSSTRLRRARGLVERSNGEEDVHAHPGVPDAAETVLPKRFDGFRDGELAPDVLRKPHALGRLFGRQVDGQVDVHRAAGRAPVPQGDRPAQRVVLA